MFVSCDLTYETEVVKWDT